MKNASAPRAGVAQALRPWTFVGLLALCVGPATGWAAAPTGASAPASASVSATSPAAAKPPAPPAAVEPAGAERRTQWQKEIAATRVPKRGCFTVTYPQKTWKEVPCGAPPKTANQPGTSPYPNNVGYGNSVAARSAGLIAAATGSFDSVTPATLTASGPVRGNPGQVAPDAFSLQLNTQPFDTAACAGGGAACKGWVQFIYSRYQCSPGPCVFIEYWLRDYGPTCPAGWTPLGSGDHCYRNSPPVNAPGLTAAQLQGTSLVGQAVGGPGGDDVVTLVTTSGGTPSAFAATSPNLLNLQQQWNTVEWNVVGDCCISRVNFSAGTSIVARVTLNDGSQARPTCVVPVLGTAETNNLNFGPSKPATSGAGPALVFMESDPGGGLAPNCAAATSVGDTHLTTFSGLLYDFQATGDFVLAQVEPDFEVQTRQVSGKPTWPEASVNQAFAARLGPARVALCLGPARLFVDGKPTELAEGRPMPLAGGGSLSRTGNVYLARGGSGDSVRAQVHPTWIDVSVGLGRWPAKAGGLLANVGEDTRRMAARDGSELAVPFTFEQLYGRFAESWRVAADASMLSVCGAKEVERGVPRRPFYAEDLDPKQRAPAREVCEAAGVKGPDLLDACTLDVVFTADKTAAAVFVGMREPVAVARVKPALREGGALDRFMPWLPWVALLGFALLAALTWWRWREH